MGRQKRSQPRRFEFFGRQFSQATIHASTNNAPIRLAPMSGVLGWVGLRDQAGPPALDAMTVQAARLDGASFTSETEPGIAVATGGPSQTSGVFRRHGLIAAFHG